MGTILQKFGKKAAAADDDKPIFIRPLKDLAVHDGDKVTLQVEVTGRCQGHFFETTSLHYT